MSIGKIYGQERNPRVVRSLAAAKFNGLDLQMVETQPPSDTQKPEFLAKFPVGKVPAFEGSDGFLLCESRAIVEYVAGLSDNTKLLGADKKSHALVTQWINVIDSLVTDPLIELYLLYQGYTPYNKTTDAQLWKTVHRGLKALEDHLHTNTYLVGHNVTAADLTAASTLCFAFCMNLGPSSREQYPNLLRYYTTVINQRALGGVIPVDAKFATEDAHYTPPKKEKPAKPEAPKEATAAASGAAAGGAAAAATGGEEKAKNPLDALPKSSFVMNDWKVQYSNKDTRSEAIPWFHEHFDPEGWSVWRFDFKYNEELTQVFMSSNQIGGFFTRLEATRKYLMGTAGVFGKANDSVITGVIVLRGQDWEPVLSCAPDVDSYTFSRLDLNKPEDKKFFEDMLAWEATVDGKEWADGKILK
ncbi:hypothetical protein MPSI1_000658 [Malassezia psittaci]|uniref:Elongation factor 1-gamma n=1 Tax=Malassezia psittaci TaxID=1821823 RepID=A0AAF0F335_9BASI|nr:hypothetical protein MPSI1_000658 [Malassezia psittaci]